MVNKWEMFSLHVMDIWQPSIDGFFILQTFRSLSAIVAQPKNCQFGFNNKTELKNITTTTDNNGTYQVMFQLTNMPAMSEVVVTFVAQS